MASLGSVREWHDETDVLVCGFGLSGAATAIEAHDSDPAADVLLIEKMPERHAGGNARVSGQSLLISKDVEALKDYQRTMSATNPIPEPMLDAWARRMVELEPYIEARAKEAGAQYIHGSGWSAREAVLEYPELGAVAAVAHSATILPAPSGVWLAFKANVEKRKRIRRQFETALVDLIQDPDTLEVFGAVVAVNGVRRNIKARRGVVLCTGGFENNLDMQRDYFGLSEAYPLGSPATPARASRSCRRRAPTCGTCAIGASPAASGPAFAIPVIRPCFCGRCSGRASAGSTSERTAGASSTKRTSGRSPITSRRCRGSGSIRPITASCRCT